MMAERATVAPRGAPDGSARGPPIARSSAPLDHHPPPRRPAGHEVEGGGEVRPRDPPVDPGLEAALARRPRVSARGAGRRGRPAPVAARRPRGGGAGGVRRARGGRAGRGPRPRGGAYRGARRPVDARRVRPADDPDRCVPVDLSARALGLSRAVRVGAAVPGLAGGPRAARSPGTSLAWCGSPRGWRRRSARSDGSPGAGGRREGRRRGRGRGEPGLDSRSRCGAG